MAKNRHLLSSERLKGYYLVVEAGYAILRLSTAYPPDKSRFQTGITEFYSNHG